MASPTNFNSLINLGLPAQAPDFIKNPEVRAAVEMSILSINALLRAIEQYGGITQKDITLWSSLHPNDTLLRHQQGRFYLPAFEALAFGAFINLFSDAGICKARNSSSIAKPAHGYCNVTGGSLAGAFTEVILAQGILAVTGILPGQALYLANTAGLSSTVPDTAVGRIEQFLGIGVAPGIAYIDITLGQYIQH